MRSQLILFPILFIALAVVMAASLHLGLRLYDVATVVSAFRGSLETDALIVMNLRLPRTLIGAVAGAALGLSGLLLQITTRNPLAEPGLLGVNAGAAFAVTFGTFAFGMIGLSQIAGLAVLGALGAVATVFGIALAAGHGAPSATVLLAGVTVAGILTSFTQLMLLIDETALETLLFWLSGGFADRGTELLFIGVPLLLVGLIGTFSLASALDVLRLDDDSARAIGIRVWTVRLTAIGLAALLSAGAVAMAGPVVFLGLVAPHIARRLRALGNTASIALGAVLLGAIIAVAADILARVIVAPEEMPVGAVLAFIGTPMLFALLRQRREALL